MRGLAFYPCRFDLPAASGKHLGLRHPRNWHCPAASLLGVVRLAVRAREAAGVRQKIEAVELAL
jgi:hypothetical protein